MCVFKKIQHLKRVGLVAGASTGYGRNGGACPDWLKAQQREESERRAAARARADDTSWQDDGGWSLGAAQ